MKQFLCLLLLALTAATTGNAQTNRTDDLLNKGIALYDDGNYKAALAQYLQALKSDRRNPTVNYELSLTYFALNDLPNTIHHSDAVIKSLNASPEIKAQAHVNKGSALDITGHPDQALKEYRKAAKLYPEYQMAYYNMGLTLYNQQKYSEAEQALVKAVQLKPGHSSSHLLLGYTKQAQHQRVQSVLALYNFLLLEPSTERAAVAHKTLLRMQQEGVSKGDGNAVNIMVSSDKIVDNPFSAAELMLSMMQASNTVEAKDGKTSEQLFYENTTSFFNILGELKEDQQDFWWRYYVEFFHEMTLDKNVEAFSYYIGQSDASKAWVKEHPDQVEQLTHWYQNYKR